MLFGAESFEFTDVDGTRVVAGREIESSRNAPPTLECSSPFTSGAHYDQSIPGFAAYSLLLEATDEGFRQEVYYFLARGDDDAITVSQTLGQMDSAVNGSAETRRLLYFTGFRGPHHGQVMFECTAPDSTRTTV